MEDWKCSIQGVTIPLDPDEVNFYDLITHFIIPQTKQYLCSYVELDSSKYCSVAAGNVAADDNAATIYVASLSIQ